MTDKKRFSKPGGESVKLIIAGTRTFRLTAYAIDSFVRHFKIDPTEVVCGGADGIDTTGRVWGEDFPEIPFKIFEPDWSAHGKAAGPIRNRQMAAYADALLLIWDGQSRGSKNMKEEMQKLNKPVYEVILR